MADTSTWGAIHGERKALAAELHDLTEAQWETASLCAGWSVRDVLAHLTATAKMTPGRFFPQLASAGFRFDRVADRGVAAERGTSGSEALARFESVIDATTHPPGPLDAMVGEVVVHSADIRRPLGLTRQPPIDVVVRAADFYKKSNLIVGARKRIAGLKLGATDAQWSTGTGPAVEGPVLALVQAMTGRQAALDDLTGDGVAILRSR